MKTFTPFQTKYAASFFVLIFTLSLNIFTQPQYYNSNNTQQSNSWPFGVVLGKKIQLLYLPGDFSQPSPAPSGNITKLYFQSTGTATVTHTNLLIKMGQATGLTSFVPGIWYTGQLDTVFYRASNSLSSTSGQWMVITLDRPFNFDNTKSLIIEITTCSASSIGMNVAVTITANNIRNYSILNTTCPFLWGGVSVGINNLGIDVDLVGIGNNNTTIPSEYNLEQNYPNPFNPVTSINFAIPKAGLVDLKVFDVLGRKIAVVMSGYIPAGNHTAQFDASELSSGVYFYTLTSGEFTATKKMLLVK